MSKYFVPNEGLAQITKAGSRIEVYRKTDETTPEGWVWLVRMIKEEDGMTDVFDLELSEEAFSMLVRMKNEFDWLMEGRTDD